MITSVVDIAVAIVKIFTLAYYRPDWDLRIRKHYNRFVW